MLSILLVDSTEITEFDTDAFVRLKIVLDFLTDFSSHHRVYIWKSQ